MQRQLLVLAAIVSIAVHPAVARDKKKYKHKSFEPVATADLGRYVGHYVGIEDQFWVDVEVGASGALEVGLHERGRSVPLRQIVLTGARLQATKLDEEGAEQPFDATFGDRILNGDRRFGLLVEGELRMDDDTVLARVFYRRVNDAGSR